MKLLHFRDEIGTLLDWIHSDDSKCSENPDPDEYRHTKRPIFAFVSVIAIDYHSFGNGLSD